MPTQRLSVRSVLGFGLVFLLVLLGHVFLLGLIAAAPLSKPLEVPEPPPVLMLDVAASAEINRAGTVAKAVTEGAAKEKPATSPRGSVQPQSQLEPQPSSPEPQLQKQSSPQARQSSTPSQQPVQSLAEAEAVTPEPEGTASGAEPSGTELAGIESSRIEAASTVATKVAKPQPQAATHKAMAEQAAPAQATVSVKLAQALHAVGRVDPSHGHVSRGGDEGVASGQAQSQALMNWQAEVLKRLHRFKQYPRHARYRGYQGTAYIHFNMSRSGEVIASQLKTSSGHRSLDKEALALIQRAQPLPEPPQHMAGDSVQLVVPVAFQLSER